VYFVSEVETIRRGFCPQRVTTLFVGESVPDGGTFFYQRNSQLYKYMKEAFDGGNDFLERFKANGYFLDDLIPVPVNNRTREERQRLGWESVPSLAERLCIYQPAMVVALMISIRPMVRDAMAKAGMSDRPFDATPFPGWGQRGPFKLKMAEIIPKLPKLQS
jgi:hypothetical protein